MKDKNIRLDESQLKKIIDFIERQNSLIFHNQRKEIFLLTPDDEYNTVSRVSIYPPYTVNIDGIGNKELIIGHESNSGFNYISDLKNIFLEAVTKLGLI